MPGWTGGDLPVGVSDHRARAEAALEAAENFAADIEQKLLISAVDKLNHADRIATELEAQMVGPVQSTLDTLWGVRHKMAQKIFKKPDQHYSNAFTYGIPYGVTYPTNEQVLYGLSTGDVNGAMGVLPPLDPTFGGDAPPATGDDTGTVTQAVNPPPATPPPPPTTPGNNTEEDDDGPCAADELTSQFPAFWSMNGALSGFTWPSIKVRFDQTHNAPVGPWIGLFEPWTQRQTGEALNQHFQMWEVRLPSGQAAGPEGTRFWLPDQFYPVFCADGNVYGVDRPYQGCSPFCGAGTVDETTGQDDHQPEPPNPDPPANPDPEPPGAEFCPVPDKLSCPPPVPPKIPQLGSLADNNCVDFDKIAEALKNIKPETWFHMLGMATGANKPDGIGATIAKTLLGTNMPVLPNVIERLQKWMADVCKKAATGVACDSPLFIEVTLLASVLRFVSKWLDILPDQLNANLQQLSNSLCQYIMPTKGEADEAYLSNEITKEVWECWVKANGIHPGPAEKSMKSARSRINPGQLATLFRRGHLNKQDYEDASRATGVIKDEDRKRIYDLTEAWPGLEDVIRFLVRDVADDGIVTRFSMDDNFEQKWQGELVKYADGLGVTKELAKYYWRAHWHLPSYTQLTEMQHRLRPGRVAPEIEVDASTVEEALAQDDMLPYWIPRMMAIAHHPISRTDALQAFQTRALPDDELFELFMDEGYNREDAQKMFDIQERKRKIQEVKRSGLPTARTLINQFARHQITDMDFRNVAADIAVSEEHEKKMYESGLLARRIEERKCLLANVKRQYVKGLIDEGSANATLANAGLEMEEINEIMNCWIRDRQNRGKEVSGAQLCKMYGQGLITRAVFAAALVRVGYSTSAAGLLVRSCEFDQAEKARKQAERDQDEAEAAFEKERNRQEKLRDKAQKAAEKAAKEAKAKASA